MRHAGLRHGLAAALGCLCLACPAQEAPPTVGAKAEAEGEPAAAPARESEPAPEPAPAPEPEPEPAPAPELELAFVGDIIYGRYRDSGFDPIVEGELPPFAAMAAALEADLSFANLETPVVETLPEKSPSHADYRFGASRAMAQSLVDAGFDAVSIANNHHNDQREAGHRETPQILADLGIVAAGAARAEAPAFRFETLEYQGWRVAFGAATTKLNMPLDEPPPHLPWAKTEDLLAMIEGPLREARASHDLVIVSLHWGQEYTDDPSVRQKRAARALVEAGADLVFGHHPHVLQGIESHEGGVIAYSMGNFLFENAGPVPKLTGVLHLRYTRSAGRPCLSAARFDPAVITRKPYPHPEPAEGRSGTQVRDRLQTLSRRLGTAWRENADDGSMHMELPQCAGAPHAEPAEASEQVGGEDPQGE